MQDNVLEYSLNSMLVNTNIVTDTVFGNVIAPSLAVLLLPAEKALAKFTPVKLAYYWVSF